VRNGFWDFHERKKHCWTVTCTVIGCKMGCMCPVWFNCCLLASIHLWYPCTPVRNCCCSIEQTPADSPQCSTESAVQSDLQVSVSEHITLWVDVSWCIISEQLITLSLSVPSKCNAGSTFFDAVAAETVKYFAIFYWSIHWCLTAAVPQDLMSLPNTTSPFHWWSSCFKLECFRQAELVWWQRI